MDFRNFFICQYLFQLEIVTKNSVKTFEKCLTSVNNLNNRFFTKSTGISLSLIGPWCQLFSKLIVKCFKFWHHMTTNWPILIKFVFNHNLAKKNKWKKHSLFRRTKIRAKKKWKKNKFFSEYIFKDTKEEIRRFHIDLIKHQAKLSIKSSVFSYCSRRCEWLFKVWTK